MVISGCGCDMRVMPYFLCMNLPDICIILHHQSLRWIRIIANVIQEYALINLSFIGSFYERMDVGNP